MLSPGLCISGRYTLASQVTVLTYCVCISSPLPFSLSMARAEHFAFSLKCKLLEMMVTYRLQHQLSTLCILGIKDKKKSNFLSLLS